MCIIVVQEERRMSDGKLFFNITCILMFWLLYCSLSLVLSSTVMVIVYLDILHHGIMKFRFISGFC